MSGRDIESQASMFKAKVAELVEIYNTNAHETKEHTIDLSLKSCRILKSLHGPRHHGDFEVCDGWEGALRELGWCWIPLST